MLLYQQAFTIYPYTSGQALTPGIAFASLSLFSQLNVPLFSLPLSITTTVNTLVSFRRLSSFLTATEIQMDDENADWKLEDEDKDDRDYIDDKV